MRSHDLRVRRATMDEWPRRSGRAFSSRLTRTLSVSMNSLEAATGAGTRAAGGGGGAVAGCRRATGGGAGKTDGIMTAGGGPAVGPGGEEIGGSVNGGHVECPGAWGGLAT